MAESAAAGQLAERKQAVISNKNLGVLGHRIGLAKYISLYSEFMDWATGRQTEVRSLALTVYQRSKR